MTNEAAHPRGRPGRSTGRSDARRRPSTVSWLAVLFAAMALLLLWLQPAAAWTVRPLSEREQRAMGTAAARLYQEGRYDAASGFYRLLWEATGDRHAQAMLALCRVRAAGETARR